MVSSKRWVISTFYSYIRVCKPKR